MASRLLSDQVVGEPVHQDGLRRRYRHGEVHPQLVPGSCCKPPLGGRRRQQLEAQRADLRDETFAQSASRVTRVAGETKGGFTAARFAGVSNGCYTLLTAPNSAPP